MNSSDDYISRKAAAKLLGYTFGVDVVRKLHEVPAANVAEVHYARWEEADWREYDTQSCETIHYPKAAIVCSNCRNAFKKDALWKRIFCPNCGAMMYGGDNIGH